MLQTSSSVVPLPLVFSQILLPLLSKPPNFGHRLLIKISPTLSLSRGHGCCYASTTSSSSSSIEEERPSLDINLAVILVEFAFKAYTTPPENIRKSQGTSDPYVVLQLDTQIVKTKVKWGTKEPTWNEQLTLYTKHPPTYDLQVAAWDANLVAPHRRMGNSSVSLNSLCDGNSHEALLELEGMGAGGKLQLEVKYKSFDTIEEEKNWWRLPFVAEFLRNNGFESTLKKAIGRLFPPSSVGLRSLNSDHHLATQPPSVATTVCRSKPERERPEQHQSHNLTVVGPLGITAAIFRSLVIPLVICGHTCLPSSEIVFDEIAHFTSLN
ncbi:hypothetical protein QVD17_11192 [Tagetes erecta]|uniref:C2 domain-containing protein n=1 Tax=Tagetes erecta TaxID=13708 RepID=A0AAD8KWV2_TARER|nr:hypothetical protein QVD17_11192 [Tagetes erecta]